MSRGLIAGDELRTVRAESAERDRRHWNLRYTVRVASEIEVVLSRMALRADRHVDLFRHRVQIAEAMLPARPVAGLAIDRKISPLELRREATLAQMTGETSEVDGVRPSPIV